MMSFLVGIFRYVFPVMTLIILAKCFLTLLLGHPINKTYGYIVNKISGERLALNTWETSIGRSKQSDIVLEIPSVSRFHAVISRRRDGWYIFDTLSKYGTFVNGKKVEDDKTVIKHADEISFGEDAVFYFVISDDPVINKVKKQRGRKKNVSTENMPQATPPQPAPAPVVREGFKIPDDFDPAEIEISQRKKNVSLDIDYGEEEFSIHPGRKKPVTRAAYAKPSKEEMIHTPLEIKQPVPKLVNTEDGRAVPLKSQQMFIGRGSGNDIVVNDKLASKVHAVITQNGGSRLISDRSSTNGTKVNGRKITAPVVLKNNDIITVGQTEFRFIIK